MNSAALLQIQRVTVVGGGASAYDLLDLCFAYQAKSIAWVYRSTKCMSPTRQAKYLGVDMRLLAKYQMLGLSSSAMNRRINEDLRARYKKAGITEIMPEGDFDIRRDQLIPCRPRMIQRFRSIERHRGEVQSVHGKMLALHDHRRHQNLRCRRQLSWRLQWPVMREQRPKR